jgi:hypothetical protein
MTIAAIDRAPIAVPTELARGRGGGGPASKRVVVAAAVAGLSIFYLLRGQPLLVQGEADATRFDIAARVDGRVAEIPVERGQNVAAGARIARAPKSDAARINLWPAFQIRYRSTPIRDLSPRIHILPRLAGTDTKGPMIVQQNDEPGGSERFGEFGDTVLPRSGVPMSHGDPWQAPTTILRHVEPRAELYAAVNRESNLFADGHYCISFAGASLAEPMPDLHRRERRPSSEGILTLKPFH